jgi:gamma-glutamylcysteine synthetase
VAQHFETSDWACFPYAYTEFMTKRNQTLHVKSASLRSEERGWYLLLFVLHTVYVCVPGAMNRKQLKKDGKEISDYRWMSPNDSMSC